MLLFSPITHKNCVCCYILYDMFVKWEKPFKYEKKVMHTVVYLCAVKKTKYNYKFSEFKKYIMFPHIIILKSDFNSSSHSRKYDSMWNILRVL